MLTETPLVLDTDFISSFAWIDRLDILASMYSGRMLILDEVLEELKRVPHLAAKVECLIQNGAIKYISMDADSPEAVKLGELLDSGRYGSGEAACMAYLTCHAGILASNNLADVQRFCLANNQQLLTTAGVICNAYNSKLIDLEEANRIWDEMIKRMRKLPAKSFSDYLAMMKS